MLSGSPRPNRPSAAARASSYARRAGRRDLEVGTFSLREALENDLTMLKERAGRHGITLSVEVEPDLDVIEANERKVKQVVFNLVSNAVTSTPDGGRVDVTA